jgi:hypothetical protein
VKQPEIILLDEATSGAFVLSKYFCASEMLVDFSSNNTASLLYMPSEALDNESESIVQAALDKLMASKERTIIVIAHRVSCNLGFVPIRLSSLSYLQNSSLVFGYFLLSLSYPLSAMLIVLHSSATVVSRR